MKYLKTYEQSTNFQPKVGDILIINKLLNDNSTDHNVYFIIAINASVYSKSERLLCFYAPLNITTLSIYTDGETDFITNRININETDYKLLTPEYFYEKFSDSMIDVINAMKEYMQFGDKQHLENCVNIWTDKIPELKMRIEADKFNL